MFNYKNRKVHYFQLEVYLEVKEKREKIKGKVVAYFALFFSVIFNYLII